jgi:single-strand DNA-binding protein
MAGSVNKVILLGNVGADPSIHRRRSDNEPICNFTLATSESWRDKNTGERKEKTEWHRITAFPPISKIVEQYIKKGKKLYIEGHLETRKWVDKENIERYSTDVILSGFNCALTMLDSKPQGGDDEHHDQTDRPERNAYADAAGKAQPASRDPISSGPGHVYKSDFAADQDIPF